MSYVRAIAVAVVLPTLPGCAMLPGYDDEFACPGADHGSPCMSATEVYAASNRAGTPAADEANEAHEQEGGEPDAARATEVTPVRSAGLSIARIETPKPIRTPARVMRIYLAPWVSEDGTLMMPTYLYTEIEPRRWTIGERVPATGAGTQRFYPLQVNRRSDSNTGRSAPGEDRGSAAQSND